MLLKAVIEEHEYTLEVSDAILTEARGFFDKLDADMDAGWQMSRDWVARPDRIQRAQIVADKLLTALEKENHKMGMLMAGYILDRLPGIERVHIDIHGEIDQTAFDFAARDESRTPQPESAPSLESKQGGTDHTESRSPLPSADQAVPPSGLSKLDAMERAGEDVTKVFKVGKGYRFSIYDRAAGQWADSPVFSDLEEAETMRQAAFKQRFDQLVEGG